uniref:ARAD1D43758p n=1 Tax=Blastobotrys adeninivorans TaxID=409370 RepID=A0A060TI55_BLAAD
MLDQLLYVPIAAILYSYIAGWIREWRYRQSALKHDCALPSYLEYRPLGIPMAIRTVKAHWKNELIQLLNKIVDDSGKETFRAQTLGLLGYNAFYSSNPENIRAVLTTKFDDYSYGLRHDVFHPLLGDGIFTVSGSRWHQQRALLKPQFNHSQVYELDHFKHACTQLLELMRIYSQRGYFDMQDLAFKFTLDTTTLFLFGESTGCLDDEMKRLHENGQDQAGKTCLFAEDFNKAQLWMTYRMMAQSFYWMVQGREFRGSVKRCQTYVDHYVSKALVKREKQQEEQQQQPRQSLLDELTKRTRDPRALRDQVLNLLLAGRDTTASLISLVIALLVRHQDIQRKLREAVIESMGVNEENISHNQLKRCKYLQNVINETLRLYPVVPMNGRQVARDTVLPRGGGEDETLPIFLPKGAQFAYSISQLHRNQSYWGDDAAEFRPERWVNHGPKHSWTFLPFSGGPRACLGQRYALTEASYAIARIMQQFKELKGAPPGGPIKLHLSLTTRVAGGVSVQAS